MDCANCGNYIPDTEDVCQTCGTPRPEGPDHEVGSTQELETPSANPRAIVAFAVGALVLAGAAWFLVTRESDVPGAASSTGTVASDAPEDATGDAAGIDSAPGPGDWLPPVVVGSLTAFTSPDSDDTLGEVSPTVDGFDFEGNTVAITDDGLPKVIVFLAHWCPHCQAEVPVVQAYLDEAGLPAGVDFITVATAIDDGRPNYPPDEWLEREGWNAPVIVDPDGTVATAFGLTGFPYYVFLREDFTVDFRVTGAVDPALVFEYAESLFGPGPDRTPLPIGPFGYDEAVALPTACGGTAPEPRSLMTFPEPGVGASVDVMTLVTSCGEIRIDLDVARAPESVNSILFLAAEGYFDGTVCHRLVPGFVLQCGDPTATGTGGPGYSLPDEFPGSGYDYAEGVVAMANAGPGTTGSQFFVVIGDASFLPPNFTVVGSVADVGPLIAALSQVPLGDGGRGEISSPLETVYIESVRIGE